MSGRNCPVIVRSCAAVGIAEAYAGDSGLAIPSLMRFNVVALVERDDTVVPECTTTVDARAGELSTSVDSIETVSFVDVATTDIVDNVALTLPATAVLFS